MKACAGAAGHSRCRPTAASATARCGRRTEPQRVLLAYSPQFLKRFYTIVKNSKGSGRHLPDVLKEFRRKVLPDKPSAELLYAVYRLILPEARARAPRRVCALTGGPSPTLAKQTWCRAVWCRRPGARRRAVRLTRRAAAQLLRLFSPAGQGPPAVQAETGGAGGGDCVGTRLEKGHGPVREARSLAQR